MSKIKQMAFLLCFLFLFDSVATVYWLASEKAIELNPLMDYFISKSYILFTAVKLGISFVSLLVIYQFREQLKHIVFYSLFGLNVVYILLFLYHMAGLLFLN